jgi:hypothetical protein
VYANFRAFDDVSDRLRKAQPTTDELIALRKYRWPALTDKEAALLRIELKSLPKPPSIRVICADSDCRDFADSFFKLFHDLQWPVIPPVYGAGIPSTKNPTGILVIQNDIDDRRLVDAIEKSTTGRLKITLQKDNDPQVTIAIGAKPSN